MFFDRKNFFTDRQQAGRLLANKLTSYKGKNCLILALVRGGVPVAFEVAKKLKLSMDVIVARKIGAPGNPEFGIGAICEKNVIVLDKDIITRYFFAKKTVDDTIKQERKELARRIETYRQGKSLSNLTKKIVILIDDGIATGVTVKAAIKTIKKLKAKYIILAVPVAAKDSLFKLKKDVDKIICLNSPRDLTAIGLYYQNFDQTTDEQVIDLLKKIRALQKKKSS